MSQRPIAWFVLIFFIASIQGDLFLDPPTSNQEDPPEDFIITVDSTNLRFSPSSVTVTEGDTVRFFWSGQALPHNAVEQNEVFDSGEPERNVDYSFTFEIGMNGTYDFVCEPHAAFGMVGQIIVEPAPMPPPDNTTNETNTTMTDEAENMPHLPLHAVSGVLVLAALVRSKGRY